MSVKVNITMKIGTPVYRNTILSMNQETDHHRIMKLAVLLLSMDLLLIEYVNLFFKRWLIIIDTYNIFDKLFRYSVMKWQFKLYITKVYSILYVLSSATINWWLINIWFYHMCYCICNRRHGFYSLREIYLVKHSHLLHLIF